VETYWHAVNERKWGSHSFVQEREREKEREGQGNPRKREKVQARASVVAVVY